MNRPAAGWSNLNICTRNADNLVEVFTLPVGKVRDPLHLLGTKLRGLSELLFTVKVFDERGIEIPFPHRTLYWGVPKDGAQPSIRLSVNDRET